MSRTKSRRSRRENTDRSATVDVVSQLETAIRYPQATLIGAVVGGVVPWFARTLAHEELPSTWSAGHHALALFMLAVVAGCACFSALTVYKFGRATFSDKRKALGFVLAIEGVMLVSQGVTSGIALAILVAINALGNGSSIALARDATCRRREADGRRAATAAARRAATRGHVPTVSVAPAASTSVPRAKRTAPAPVWMDDVMDAEVVSEQKLLS